MADDDLAPVEIRVPTQSRDESREIDLPHTPAGALAQAQPNREVTDLFDSRPRGQDASDRALPRSRGSGERGASRHNLWEVPALFRLAGDPFRSRIAVGPEQYAALPHTDRVLHRPEDVPPIGHCIKKTRRLSSRKHPVGSCDAPGSERSEL